MNTTGLLLAGGRSARLGYDKRLIDFRGERLISTSFKVLSEVCEDTRVLVATEKDMELLQNELPEGTQFILDQSPNEGPMSALLTGLEQVETDSVLLLAVDYPLMTAEFLCALCSHASKSSARACMPSYEGHLQVLSAVYTKSVLEELRLAFDQGERSLRRWALEDRTGFVVVDPAIWSEWGTDEVFFNLNEIGDLEFLRSRR